MFEFCKKQYNKYKEVINYLIFGVLTTLVNFIVYIGLAKGLNVNEMLANIVAWILSVIFAYITNKLYVFESKTENLQQIIREFTSFVACRLFSGILDIVSFYIFVTILNINDILAKVIVSVVVVILNYVFSKIFIFKKQKNKTDGKKDEN